MSSFWVAFWLIFWAEMGDKTQFVAMAYATRYPIHHVILGLTWSIALVFMLFTGAGTLIGSHIPIAYVQVISALCFLAFAVWTLRGCEDESEESPKELSKGHPIVLIGTTFFFAEFGDKTMFAAAALAATRPWMPVWGGSVLAMVAADGLAVVVGRVLGKKIPDIHFKWVTATIFFGFSLWTAFEAYRSFKTSL